MALAAIPGGWLSERLGYRAAVMFGLIVAIVGFWMMSLWKTEMAAQAVAFFEHLGRGRPAMRPTLGAPGSWPQGWPWPESASTHHRANRDGRHQRGRRTRARNGVIARASSCA